MPAGSLYEIGVRETRESLGLTQTALARALGISVLTVSRWENGRTRPAERYLRAISALTDAAQPSLAGAGSPRTSATGFVGRTRELGAVLQAVKDHGLVTLTGPGGVGKSRIAREAGERFARGRPEVAVRVDLGATGAGEVAAVLDRVLQRHAFQSLAEPLRLVILDNCEHLIEDVARLYVERLKTDGLTVLATSRRPLGAAAEHVIAVPPLSVPSEGASEAETWRSESVQLFVARARERDPHAALPAERLSTIGRLCRALDGLPLAIELAAARTMTMSVEDIARRLDRRLELLGPGTGGQAQRHGTLQASIGWSYDLLSAEARDVFDSLGAFPASFELDAVEAATATPSAAIAIGEVVEGSLVHFERGTNPGRYRLLESFRVFARGRLTEKGQLETIEARLADYYAGLAQGLSQAQLEIRLSRDAHNYVAAMRWLAARGEWARVLAMLQAARPLIYRGYAGELLQWYASATDVSSQLPAEARAEAAAAWTAACLGAGDITRAAAIIGPVADSLTGLEPPGAAGDVLVSAALADYYGGRYESAETHLRAAMEQFQRAGLPLHVAYAELNCGLVLLARGEIDRAREALACARANGDLQRGPLRFVALAELAAGDICVEGGELLSGKMAYEGAISLLEGDERESFMLAVALARHSLVASRLNRHDESVATVVRALAIPQVDGLAIAALALAAASALRARSAGAAARVLAALEGFCEWGGVVTPAPMATDYARLKGLLDGALAPGEAAVAVAAGRAGQLREVVAEAMATALGANGLEGPSQGPSLTAREREVLVALVEGATNHRIALRLGISQRTVDRHVSGIYARLGVHSRAEAAAWAVRHAILSG
jgi:predicted ATPase/DNA-binding CsgD family transcriptional regulator